MLDKRQAKCAFERFGGKVSGAMWSCVISCVGGGPQEPTSASVANEFGRKDNRVRRCRIINDDKDETLDLSFFFSNLQYLARNVDKFGDGDMGVKKGGLTFFCSIGYIVCPLVCW